MHLDEERIQRILHEEIDSAGGGSASRHLETCVRCRDRLREARREEVWIHDLLLESDAPLPVLAPEDIAIRSRRLVLLRTLRWAAAALLVIGAAAAVYSAPGSPLPGWMHRVAGWIDPSQPATQAPAVEAQEGPKESGIAVAPGDRFTVRFAARQRSGVLTLSLHDGADLVVHALGGGATFATSRDMLAIENLGSSGDLEIELPRGAPWVEIVIEGRRVALKEGDRLLVDSQPDSRGRYLLAFQW